MKTVHAKPDQIIRRWYVVDLKDKVLGRAASRIASILKGKHKPIYSTHQDTGDFIIALNADKVILTGTKWQNKIYYHHTGHPGGIKDINAEELRQRHPDQILKHAVKGMLPKSPLGRKMLKKLKVYTTGEHPHEAQKPEVLEL